MTLFVYRHNGVVGAKEPDRDRMKILWHPSLNKWIPPGKNKKYLAYWIFHYARLFRNRDYFWLALQKGNIKASMLCVPTHFRWPFMAANDIQFTYVMAAPGEKGKGWGSNLIQSGIELLERPGRSFWYVTDGSNLPSRKLADRAGFALVGTATYQSDIFKRLYLDPVVHNAPNKEA